MIQAIRRADIGADHKGDDRLTAGRLSYGFLRASCCITRSSRISPEFHPSVTRISVEFCSHIELEHIKQGAINTIITVVIITRSLRRGAPGQGWRRRRPAPSFMGTTKSKV